ncbi:MAG TPA: hypothetical protein VF944_07175, partial [Candidatus Bathyarchaeia archaeon]
EEPIEEANERSTPTSTVPQYNWAHEPYGLAHSVKWYGRIDMMHHVTITGIPGGRMARSSDPSDRRFRSERCWPGSLSACSKITLNMLPIEVTIMKRRT